MKVFKLILLTLFASASLTLSHTGYCQEEGEVAWKSKHRFGPFLAYAFVPNLEGQIELIPVIGLDYEYWLHKKFGIGLSNDFDVLSYQIETSDGEELEREFAFVSTLNLVTKPVAGLILSAGGGIELEKHKNFGVFRMALGWEFELNHRVDLEPMVAWEMKGKAEYHALNIGLVVGLNWHK